VTHNAALAGERDTALTLGAHAAAPARR
jgi:hypothetical protein